MNEGEFILQFSIDDIYDDMRHYITDTDYINLENTLEYLISLDPNAFNTYNYLNRLILHAINMDDTSDLKLVQLLLKKLEERDSDKIHNDLKSSSKDFIKDQQSSNKRNVNMKGDNFDINLFNKTYDENRLKDDFADDGYGDWLKEKEEETGVKMDQFNKTKFHNEFLKQKKKKVGRKLQKYAEPEELVSMSNKDSIMILGKEKVSSYSGESNGLAYRDLREAYTESTLIDTSSVDLSKRKNNIKDYNLQRKNTSHQMSESDIRAQVMREEDEKREEVARLSRVTNRDKEIGTHYEMMHQRLMGN